jgi:hypothetical protein
MRLLQAQAIVVVSRLVLVIAVAGDGSGAQITSSKPLLRATLIERGPDATIQLPMDGDGRTAVDSHRMALGGFRHGPFRSPGNGSIL